MSEFIYQIKNLTYHNSDGYIDNINLNLGFKQVHVLIVKNSSEQSVFIHSLKAFEEDIQGKILFKGKRMDGSLLNKSDIVFLHQKPVLVNNLSVAENLSLTNIPKRKIFPLINWKKLKKTAQETLDRLNFELNHNTKVGNLSRENKKIVYIAQVFMKNPQVIIMHEPTEGLSAHNVSKLYRIIQDYKENGGSVIYITKQWEEALKLGDQISVLSKGSISGELSADMAKKDPQTLLNILEDYKYKGSREDKDEGTQSVLDAVFKAAEFLTSEYELKDVLRLLAKEVTKVMNADGCVIDLIDESTSTIIDTLEFKTRKEFQTQLKKEAIIKIAQQGDIYYSNQQDRVFNSLFEKMNDIKTIICIPVLIRSQITGIIQIYYEDFYVYSKEESKYLSAFARHAAIAIESTRLMGRSALLQESHHRIKNNLQSIVGLISLQKRFIDKNPQKSIDDILDNITSRVKSIAAVHDLLSRDKLGRSIINVKKIIEVIVDFINIDTKIAIYLDLDNIFIPYSKASSIALIINELVLNCLKHAFLGRDTGTIHIQCKRFNEDVFLLVKDNGVGLAEKFDLSKLDSLGLSIVHAIVTNEFHGKMDFNNEDGTEVKITLPDQKILLK
ncbi:ribose import ATP-binding protein RbsA [Clostridium aceticum]|uniref:Ribose import ATP-binding protein RbsA n=1 Tax=Clostridium aceticum TaxID=84022 RepID=A0A0D8I9H1_9CLOT|nr:histidine kinase dimerization/phosphoacceptor domain -containing protein [Clostridium aceticum]AKL93835.1 ribose import ATP-binding protein RbsA [Clostridium aceticum]KJF25861.1 hypothetical protein TZ02_16870 [Clostridium aceticum]